MTYDGLKVVHNAASPDLGGNISHGDPFTFAPGVWSYLVHRFAVRTVLDVGCGEGHAARYFSSVLGCTVVAVDGLADNLATAVYPIIIHDLKNGPFVTKVDLVHCTEVVEHLDETYVPNLMQTLAAAPVIAMTHAVPGQDGHHHVNCQPDEYWCALLLRHGYHLAEEDTRRVRDLGGREGAIYFARSGLIFAKH